MPVYCKGKLLLVLYRQDDSGGYLWNLTLNCPHVSPPSAYTFFRHFKLLWLQGKTCITVHFTGVIDSTAHSLTAHKKLRRCRTRTKKTRCKINNKINSDRLKRLNSCSTLTPNHKRHTA